MKIYKNTDFCPSHPGIIFKDGFMEQFSSIIDSAMVLEDQFNMTRWTLVRFINGQSSVTAELAGKLEQITTITKSQWLELQTRYDDFEGKQTDSNTSQRKTYKGFIHRLAGAIRADFYLLGVNYDMYSALDDKVRQNITNVLLEYSDDTGAIELE